MRKTLCSFGSQGICRNEEETRQRAATQDSPEHGTDHRTNERSTLTELRSVRSGLVNAYLYRSFNDLWAAGGRAWLTARLLARQYKLSVRLYIAMHEISSTPAEILYVLSSSCSQHVMTLNVQFSAQFSTPPDTQVPSNCIQHTACSSLKHSYYMFRHYRARATASVCHVSGGLH